MVDRIDLTPATLSPESVKPLQGKMGDRSDARIDGPSADEIVPHRVGVSSDELTLRFGWTGLTSTSGGQGWPK